MSDKDLFQDETDRSLMGAFGWWEKRRMSYNLIVGGTGIACLLILSMFPLLTPLDYIGMLLYCIIANLFYSLGFLIEVVARYYFKNESGFTQKRKVLFGLGLVFSIITTIGLSFAYAFIKPLPYIQP